MLHLFDFFFSELSPFGRIYSMIVVILYGITRFGNFRQKNNSAEDGGLFPTEFRSEPFRGRENNSEFRSVD
jgi:hypothetical protein